MVKEIHMGFPSRAFEPPMMEATANYPEGLAHTDNKVVCSEPSRKLSLFREIN